jgi:hypothetical protein
MTHSLWRMEMGLGLIRSTFRERINQLINLIFYLVPAICQAQYKLKKQL